MKVGVLALQGAFKEHIQKLNACGVEAIEVRLPEQLIGLDGLIIPGGESTAIGKLIDLYKFREPLQNFKNKIWGTCAGMIIVANEIEGEDPWLKLIDVTVQRNAFGRQIDSFATQLDCKEIGKVEAIFIRAPIITKIGNGVEILATLEDGTPVAARENNVTISSFHPELGKSNTMHQWFVDEIRKTTSKH